MSALDDVIHFHEDNCTLGSECDLSALSRAELAAMRQRIAEFETVTSERDYLARRVESLQITLNSINDDNDHMRQRIAEFDAAANAMRSTFDALIGSGDTTAATLKPRQCCAKCDARAEAVRAAAKFELEQMSRDRQGDVEVVILSCAKKISAMPLPPCADCNPLAPEA